MWHKETYPKGIELRKKLFMVLIDSGKPSIFVHALVGHVVDNQEHHVLDPEVVKLVNDEDYRKQQVDFYLEKYKAEIAKIVLPERGSYRITLDKRRRKPQNESKV